MNEPYDLPLYIKELLLDLSKELPRQESRKQFVRNVGGRLKQLSIECENTLIYTAAGWVIGEILDHALVVPFFNYHLTDDHAASLVGLAGGIIGYKKDIKISEEQEMAIRVIREELQKARNYVK